MFVGKHVGAHAWPQARINAVMVAEARKGRRVVRLKSGDPGIFERAGEEIEAARSAGIPVDIVPDVTAAAAAGAALGHSLTERGVSDTLALSTGTGRAEDPRPDCTSFAGPGTITAIYMGVRQADRICTALRARGLSGTAPVEVCVDASKPSQRLVSTTLAELTGRLAAEEIGGCAILPVTLQRGPWRSRITCGSPDGGQRAQPSSSLRVAIS